MTQQGVSVATTNKLSPPSSAADSDLSTRALMATTTAKLSRVSLVTSFAALAMALSIWRMVPLKQSVPYVVQVNESTGEVSVPKNQSVAAFDPAWANIEFFLRRWAVDMFTINQYLTVNINDPRAQQFLRGNNAITEYKDYRAKDDTFGRLAEDPSLVRDVQVLSMTQIAGTKNGVVAQIAMTTHKGGKVTTDTKLVTIYFVLLKSNDPETLRQNPIGVYVTDFKLSDA